MCIYIYIYIYIPYPRQLRIVASDPAAPRPWGFSSIWLIFLDFTLKL